MTLIVADECLCVHVLVVWRAWPLPMGVSELAASPQSPHLRELPMSLKILNE